MKILIYLAVWQRPEITEICFMGITRLREYGIHEIDALAVISETEMIPLCEKYSVKWCMYKNDKLGEKKNHGLKSALKMGWNYLVEIGSDDLLFNEYLDLITPFLGKKHMITMSNLLFMDSSSGKCIEHRATGPFGLGRAISRDAIEFIGNIWNPDINRNLDADSSLRITSNGFFGKQIITDYPIGVDIKSDVNIWRFNELNGCEYDISKLYDKLSEAEVNAIKCLITMNKSASLIDA